MTDLIPTDLFNHLVDLAALELDQAEAKYLHAQLNKQLRSIEELLAIPIDPETPPAAHGVPYTPTTSPAIRADEWLPDPNTSEILEAAPETYDGFFVVPDIPHSDL